ncbi:MAG: acyloxyacyl hydrolase [Arenicellales bacterium]
MKKLCALLALFLAVCVPAHANSIGARVSVAQINTDTKENFDAYELFGVFNLPWSWQRPHTKIQTQLEVTGADLEGGGQSGFLGTLGGRVAFVRRYVTFDFGGGVAAVGKNRFGRQNFGGALQFIAQAGADFHLTRKINAGVRIRHMSDGGLHVGGEDLNLIFIELSYNINGMH